MIRSALVAGFVACAAVAPAMAQGQPQPIYSPYSTPVVVTQGEAVVKRAPDRAWLTVATETRDARAEEARRLSAEAITAVQDALRKAGLGDDAIRTTGYSLTPEMDWKSGRGIVRGYVVRNQIEVRVDNLDQLPAVIDAATTARATTLSITGPRFALKDESSAQGEALRNAVTSAMNRARAIAAGAGRTVGEVLRIDDQVSTPFPPPQPLMRMAAAEDATSTPITPGEIEIRATVTLTVELR